MRRIILTALFFVASPITLAISIMSLIAIDQLKTRSIEFTTVTNAQGGQFYAALPATSGEVLGEFSSGDARPVIIEKYLEKHKSPLLPMAQEVFNASERWGVDYRLIVAIAQCESNLCKKMPLGSYNCWGFENGETRFLSWEQALDQVTKTLRTRYINKGLTTPETIMPKYAPPSVEKGGPWARCVNQFMQELERGEVE